MKSGTLGWASVAAGVLAWDLLAQETLSDAFERARKDPASAAAVYAAWVILTAHLFGLLPKQADPFTLVTRVRDARVRIYQPNRT